MLEGTSGGARKHVIDLLLGLNKERYAITFIYSSQRADAVFESLLPVLDRVGIERVEVPMNRGFQGIGDFNGLLRLKHVFRRIRPDLVHAHGAKAGALGRFAARMHGVKGSVYTPHGGSFHKFGGGSGLLYLMIEKSLAGASNHIIGVSESSCEVARKHRLARPDHIHLVHNGIDLAQIDVWKRGFSASNHQKNRRPDSFTVLYPASFLEAKGHLQLLDALDRSQTKLLPGILILLAGEGPLRDKVHSRIYELGLERHFQFLGFQPNLYAWYQRSDLVLLPSRFEDFPYVLLEAMAFSKPVLATRVGGIPELVEDGCNGFLIDPAHLMELPVRLNAYSRDPDFLQAVGEKGRSTVERGFTVERMVAATETIYENILSATNLIR
ncbi:glycosyltransferase [Desulforhabdus amnigena]|uniref:Transferase n=1 Tax=Desulforhabdus amnigena TaxID=40218 RepID=A0A9W6CYM9_9BACT|nr:glycosyltransferase [Desulforhabdus amnigena]GLI32632.1 transferase [Desulforhabdus amnigena]